MKDLFWKWTILIVAIPAMLSSCDYKSKTVKRLEFERDSLAAVVAQQDAVADEMNNYLDIISSSIDSIKAAESIYTLRVDQEGRKLKNSEIRENLATLEDIIHRQRSRIEDLEKRLQASNNAESKYKVLIANLYAQIDEKDAKIREMQTELDQRNRTIAVLNTQVTAIKQDLADAEIKNKEQGEMLEQQKAILDTQDKMANTGFVISATRRELLDRGIVKGLSTKLVSSNLSTEGAFQVDMREFNEMSFASKRIKVLSDMPADSYVITKTSDGSTLTITDKGRFWSVSSYLVIQY